MIAVKTEGGKKVEIPVINPMDQSISSEIQTVLG